MVEAGNDPALVIAKLTLPVQAVGVPLVTAITGIGGCVIFIELDVETVPHAFVISHVYVPGKLAPIQTDWLPEQPVLTEFPFNFHW